MIEFIRDPLWQFIGSLIAIAALAVSIWVYLRQRQRKRLVIGTVARLPLVALGRRGIPGLEVTFEGRRIENATIFIIQVQSVGNTPIIPSDYEAPISFRFGDSARVLNVEIVDPRPGDLAVIPTGDGPVVTLSPHLLNPGDEFRVRVLVENPGGGPEARARIAGVQKLESQPPLSFAGSILTLVGVALAITVFFSPDPRSSQISEIRPDELPYAIIGVAGMVLMLTGSVATLRLLLRQLRQLRQRNLMVMTGAD